MEITPKETDTYSGNPGSGIESIQTPAALLDFDKFCSNCSRMLNHVHSLGSRLRPHMKTLKSIEAARLAIDPRHGGVAVATLNEAKYFIDNGMADVCCAVCLAPDKLGAAANLIDAGGQLSFFCDSVELARAVADCGAPFALWIEIDCGEHRTGVGAESCELLEIASIIRQSARTTLMGVATHAGHSYSCHSVEEIRNVAERERRSAVQAADYLRWAGFEVRNVSIGSTPTAIHATCSAGITEFRAGVYMAGDLVQAGLGSLAVDEIAFSVLGTVISRRSDPRQIVLDTGGLALSKDRGNPTVSKDYGYGLVTDLAGHRAFGELMITGVHQEHGEIRDVPSTVFDQLTLGRKVRIIPNHVCMTAAMYNQLHVVDGGSLAVTSVWCRTNGWSL